jgi:23S rRNA pseudouridine1911/1915/1917 synthase
MTKPSADTHTLTVATDASGRLDSYLRDQLPEFSRSRLQQLMAEGHLRIGEAVITDGSRKVRPGETITLHIPAPKPATMEAQAMALSIVYEDEHLLVINKPAGLTVHPGPGNPDHTLVNALLAHCGDSLSGIGGVERPGIVHRLDKDTSGLMVVAKHDAAHRALSAQLADRTLHRVYIAYAWSKPPRTHDTLSTQLGRSVQNRKKMAVLKSGGKEAVTTYTVQKDYPVMVGPARRMLASKVQCKLATGRTHQIRVHLTHLGCPLIGDALYGGRTLTKLRPFRPALSEVAYTFLEEFPRQALHAAELAFVHPVSGEPYSFTAAQPEDMAALEEALKICSI